jgi:hypothetical protein
VPADPTNDASSTFEFSANEAGAAFQCRLDAGAWDACSSPATAGPLADGSHTFDVRATDTAGNQETTPESYTWVVDAGPPSVSITQPSGFVNASDSDPYTVRATSPDGDVASVELFRCSDASADCSGGSWVSLGTDATAPYEASWPLDADGNRALRAVATDTLANTGSDVVNVTIDRTVPATTIDSAPSDPSASTSTSFSFSSSEGGATLECRLDGGAWGACSSPQAYNGLSEGNHVFDVRSNDAAGNVDPTPATFGWTVDTVAPETTVEVAPSDPSASSAPSFEFSASEGGSTFQCRLDGGAWDACSSPQAYGGLADGSHTFRVRATDAAGNVDGSPATHTWTIDATAPGGGLADPGQFLRGDVALSASPSDTGAGVQSVDFQVSPADTGSWTSIGVDTSDPYGVEWDTTALADGLYDLRIVVTDNASNSSPSAVVEDRVVDNTAPGATMNDPGPYLRGTVSLGADATDAGSGVATVAFERSPAGAGTWTSVAASWNTTSIADGLYDLRVRVTDNAGNSTTSAPVANRRVDNTKPSLTSSAPADGTTVAAASTLAIAASEDVTGIAGAQIDGVAAPAPAVAGDTVTYTQAFPAGPHVLAGELEDLAGNRQPIRVHFTTWSGPAADFPYVEKNSEASTSMSLRSTSDTATVTVPAGTWTGAPAGDWLVLRLDPQPASGGAGGFQPASEVLAVTAYWALDGSAVTSFSLPLQIEVDNTQAHVIPAVFDGGAWRPHTASPRRLPAGLVERRLRIRRQQRPHPHPPPLALHAPRGRPGADEAGRLQGHCLPRHVLTLLDGGERQLRPGLRLPGLRERLSREDGRRVLALGADGPVQADRHARLPGRRRGRGRQPRAQERAPQGRPQARQAHPRLGKEGAHEPRLQGGQDHVQDLVERRQGQGHRRLRERPQAGRVKDRADRLQGPRPFGSPDHPRDPDSPSGRAANGVDDHGAPAERHSGSPGRHPHRPCHDHAGRGVDRARARPRHPARRPWDRKPLQPPPGARVRHPGGGLLDRGRRRLPRTWPRHASQHTRPGPDAPLGPTPPAGDPPLPAAPLALSLSRPRR